MRSATESADGEAGSQGRRAQVGFARVRSHARPSNAVPRLAASREQTEARTLDQGRPAVRHLCHAALRAHAATGHHGGAKRRDCELEQRSNRGPHQSTEDAETGDVRRSWRRTPASARAPAAHHLPAPKLRKTPVLNKSSGDPFLTTAP